MANYDLGTLSSGIISRNGYSVTSLFPTDVFEFDIANSRTINLYLHDISTGDDADLRLYQDSNGNGIFDASDRLVASSTRGGNADDVIRYSATAGTYFAQVERYSLGSLGTVSYDLDLTAIYDVGTLDGTSVSRNGYSLSVTDPSDVFQFELTADRTINLSLHNISAGDDADLRLYQDSNGNGIFDASDRLVASSIRSGNADDNLSYDGKAGVYFARVERYGPGSSGNVTYDLDLATTGGAATMPNTYLPFDASQVFALSSNPGANHTIYLDFNGHVTSGTAWNNGRAANLVTTAFDTDGNASAFSVAELQDIWQIWQRVAEDFIPFNVNVTTALPGLDQLTRSAGSDAQWGVRVAIGGSSSDWYNAGAGGVAYLGSFNWNSDTPAFVFSESLGNDAKNIAEAITHEAGHSLGLRHDGDATREYYQGHGSGATGWAPIMGVGYSRELTQWSRGEYTGASNREDDLDIITGQNGFGYRADDYGDQLTNAASLAVSGNAAQTYGIIETNDDVDWFSFTSTTGAIALAINPFERGPNLDILAELYNGAGQLIQRSNPLGALAASFNLTLNPGQYYLSVTGTGQGNPATGYSDYGSLGQYSITGTIA